MHQRGQQLREKIGRRLDQHRQHPDNRRYKCAYYLRQGRYDILQHRSYIFHYRLECVNYVLCQVLYVGVSAAQPCHK